MLRRSLLALSALIVSSTMSAQINSSIQSQSTSDNDFVKSYSDSMVVAKEKIYSSDFKVANKKKSSLKSTRLFLPLTYYKDVVHNSFSLDSYNSNPNLLTRIYLESPSLVKNTEKDLIEQQATLVEVEDPIQHQVEIVDKVAPIPVEANAAPVEVMVLKPNFWSYKGDFTLQVLQNYVSGNWYKGGESNYSALASALMEANYNNKQKVKWENRLELKFGMQSSKSDSLHSYKTTEDLIRLTSKLGLQATKKWYYTVQLVGYTQFTHSYRSNDPALYADFLAPLNLNLSVGMDYSVDWLNHKLKGNIHLAPLAYNMKYTRLVNLAGRLGIDEGKHTKHDIGSEFTVDLEWKLMDALTWKTRLYGYTTYKRAELEWENTFNLQFNKYIGAQLFIYPRFDDGVTRDGHHGYWQLKEFASIGFRLALSTDK